MGFVVVDSSAWLEYFIEGKTPRGLAAFIESASAETHLCPTIVYYEVYKKLRRELGAKKAQTAMAYLKKYSTAIQLTATLATKAASISLEEELPMADAIIYAVTREFKARLVTSDAHFKGKPGVEFIQ